MFFHSYSALGFKSLQHTLANVWTIYEEFSSRCPVTTTEVKDNLIVTGACSLPKIETMLLKNSCPFLEASVT